MPGTLRRNEIETHYVAGISKHIKIGNGHVGDTIPWDSGLQTSLGRGYPQLLTLVLALRTFKYHAVLHF